MGTSGGFTCGYAALSGALVQAAANDHISACHGWLVYYASAMPKKRVSSLLTKPLTPSWILSVPNHLDKKFAIPKSALLAFQQERR